MKLKRYIQFIKESLKEDIEEGNLWKLNEDDIRDYLTELTDNGYLITVGFGFLEKSKRGSYVNGEWKEIEKDVYSEKVLVGDNVRPAYWIQIEKSRNISKDDVTDTLKFACSIISEQANADIEISDSDGVLDIDGILLKGGLFINTDSEDDYSGEEAESYIAIFAKQKDTIKITQKQLSEYYGWNVSLEKEGQLWAEIDLEDLSDFILSTRTQYKDSLVKGQEYMWDHYDISYYYPNRDDLFNYELDKENKILLIKSLIKSYGGFDKFHQIKYLDNPEISEIKNEDELVKFLAEERFNRTILNIVSKEFEMSEEPLSEVSDTIANWNMSAHCDDNYDEIVSDFDRIVSDELGQYEKIEKEITKFYKSKDAEGNETKKEYKDYITYYQFPYSNDWIRDIDSDYLYNKDLDDLFRDWVREQNIDRDLNPGLSDYGNVDSKKMNEDIKAYLNRYLNRTK